MIASQGFTDISWSYKYSGEYDMSVKSATSGKGFGGVPIKANTSGTPRETQESIAERIKQSKAEQVKNSVEAPEKGKTQAPVEQGDSSGNGGEGNNQKPPATGSNGIDTESLKSLMGELLAPVQSQLTETVESNQKLQAELEKVKAERDEAATKANGVEGIMELLKVRGMPQPNANGAEQSGAPMINRNINSKSDKLPEMVKHGLDCLDSAPARRIFGQGGQSVVSQDSAALGSFIRSLTADERKQYVAQLESYGRSNGLFQGSNRIISNSPTTTGDLPAGFLPQLSAFMRETHRGMYVFHQFANVQIDFGRGEGEQVYVPRANLLLSSTNENDYELSGGGVYNDVSSQTDNLAVVYQPITIKEYGRGKATTDLLPIAIPQFVTAYSMIDLMMVLNKNLMVDYYKFEDLKIRNLWVSNATTVLYNENDSVTTTSSDVGSGEGGDFTKGFADSVEAYMRERQMPSFMDGRYGLVMPPVPCKTFKASLDDEFSPTTEAQLIELSNILSMGTGQEIDRVSGYQGVWRNFHVFVQNEYGVGASGSPGVTTETIGGASNTVYESFAFGADTIGRGIGMPVEIRQADDRNYGRLDKYIWLTYQGFGALDIDSASGNQQTRVVKIRTANRSL